MTSSAVDGRWVWIPGPNTTSRGGRWRICLSSLMNGLYCRYHIVIDRDEDDGDPVPAFLASK